MGLGAGVGVGREGGDAAAFGVTANDDVVDPEVDHRVLDGRAGGAGR